MAESNAVNGFISIGRVRQRFANPPALPGAGVGEAYPPGRGRRVQHHPFHGKPGDGVPRGKGGIGSGGRRPRDGAVDRTGIQLGPDKAVYVSAWKKEPIETRPARKARGLAFAYDGKTRLLVLGSATFLDDEFIKLSRFVPTYSKGIWMVVNALHWMSEAPGLSALRPQTPADAGEQPSPEN
jgi:hypothetical protein